jgi:hypothetical protein
MQVAHIRPSREKSVRFAEIEDRSPIIPAGSNGLDDWFEPWLACGGLEPFQ